MIYLRREFVRSLFLAGSASRLAHSAQIKGARSSPVSIDLGRQLFVDDYLIAQTTLHRTFHKPRIHSASPVLKPETPLEMNNGVMPAAAPFSDGVWYDPADRLYKMWYIAGYDDGFGYAISEDGIEWRRPKLDVVPGTNRVLAPIPGYVRNGSTVWLDHDAKDPGQRFKMFAYFRRGNGQWPRMQVSKSSPEPGSLVHLYTSPDGIHWSQPVRAGDCGDNSGIFYNPFRKMWTYSIRSSDKKRGRTRSYREYSDFLESAHWEKGDVHFWLAADERDRPDPNLGYRPELYKVDCVAYESRMLGLFAIYKGPPNEIAATLHGFPKTNDLEIGFSPDGLTWQRPDRTPFLACSRQPGTWNRGYLHSAGGLCLIVGDELRFYFTGFSGISPQQGTGPYAGASTGLAVLRRDGFVSMDGPGVPMSNTDAPPPGILTTHPVTFSGSNLFVNADMKFGELRIEMLDATGRAITPFSLGECIPVTGDATKHIVIWKQGRDLAPLRGKPVRFRFQMTAGQLYSFWVSPDSRGASHGYVAAGGSGFTGSTDTTGA